MNIQGLTRENVASHLQKYRLYLKRLRGNIPEPRPVASFQAARDGKSGGTMQIRQRGKTGPSSSPLSSSSSALKAFPSRLELTRDLDRATLKLLEQFQANEQKLAANRSTNVHLDQGYESGAELHIMNHVGWLRKNLQGDGGHRPSAVHDSAAQSFKVDFAELDKTKPPPRLFALSTNESQIQNPSATAKSLEEINIGKEEAKRSIDEPLYIDQEELLFNTFVEAEFRHVTVPPDHDQMPNLIAAAGDLPEEYLMLANNFLSKAV
jgi:hypothetical protein